MKYKIEIRKSDEGYSVSVPGLPGCRSQGATQAEALDNIKDAIREYLTVVGDNLKLSARPADELNPYKSPTVEPTESPKSRRRRLSLAEVFTVTAMVAFVSLTFAPAVGTRGPYSIIEQGLAMMSSTWLTVFLYCVVSASMVTAIVSVIRRLLRRPKPHAR